VSLQIVSMPEAALPWMTERTGLELTSGLRGIMAVDGKGKIHGAVGFDRWLGNAAHVHIALDNPLVVRSLAPAACAFLFGAPCWKEIAIGVIPAHNERSLRLATRVLGFKVVHRFKDGWAPQDDVVLLEMRKEDCKWLGGN